MVKQTLTKALTICALAIIAISQNALAQAPDTLWTNTFGGSSEDHGNSVQQTADGGYIITGNTYSYGAGGADVWLIKTDASGDTAWTKTFGSSGQDEGRTVQQTADLGYIIIGSYLDSLYLLKTDNAGNEQWHRTWKSGEYAFGRSVQQTTDGGYILIGDYYYYMEQDLYYYIWLIKTDSSGLQEWENSWDAFMWASGWCVQQTSDGGYILTGSLGIDLYLIKTDSSGTDEWLQSIGQGEGHSVRQTTDGGYIIAGQTESYGAGLNDVWLIKTDALGDTAWTKTFGGSGQDVGWSVQQTTDGGYIITGSTSLWGSSSYDVWIIKTDSVGDLQWEQSLEGSDDSEGGRSVQQTSDGGYIITGTTWYVVGNRDVWLIRVAPEAAPELSVSPDSIDFADIVVGEMVTEQLSVTNAGTADLNISSIAISGTDSLNFSVDTTSFTLAVGDSLFLDVNFTSDDTGSFSASLDIDSDGGSASVSLVGNSVAPEISVLPVSIDFGNIEIGETVIEHVTVTNAGSADLNVSSIAISGADSLNFMADTTNFTLAPDSSLILVVGFTPDDTGSFSASLDLESDGGSASVALTGNGFEVVSIDESAELLTVFSLSQNIPNPFNPVTTIRYDLPEQSFVTMTIYDLLGREVATLVNRIEEPGYKSILWNATNNRGQPVSAGLYLYQIRAKSYVKTNKMILLK